MIAKCHCREVHLVQGLGNLLATIEGVEKGSLELVSDVEPQAVVVVWPLLFHHSLDAGVTAKAPALRTSAVSPRRRELVQMSVNIVDVKECYSLLVLAFSA